MFICLIHRVYLFDSCIRVVFATISEKGFSICIRFPNYESVTMYMYNFTVNSEQMKFENHFMRIVL